MAVRRFVGVAIAPGAQSMTSRTARASAVAAVTVLFAAGLFGLVAQMLEPPDGAQTRIAQFLYLLNPVVTSVLSGYLVVVRPRHPADWLTMLIALSATVDSLSKAVLVARTGTASTQLRAWAGWLDNWVWVLLFGGICLLVQTFPDGRLLSARWSTLLVFTIVSVLGEGVLCALVGANRDYVHVPALMPAIVPERATGVGFLAVLASLIASVASLAVRRRRYRRRGYVGGILQIRWLLWAAGVVVVVLLAGAVVDTLAARSSLTAAVSDISSQIAFYGFPVAIVIAVTRHGLFEIDRIVSRTVAYLVITGLLVGTYVGIIAGLSALLPAGVNSLVVASATLAVAALFVPVRRAVQQRVDRRFNRVRYNRAAIVERYAESLRRDVTHGSDGAELLAVVHQALQPTHAGLWMINP